ncbi:UDP-N-acetylmuramoylalanine--D-glutamate ligase [Roseibium hamelinense]|uniref:UDP-N-acetylmuramoylalanine--D-glutamate ligase n=1 Tax=Roseibium hamelinense TaxID=150831 RepID=A0A562TAK3_9HYPH|nr:UDP-N-acetylmuramoyl-L-alanine--D-glutamate ligase [Roseibium hamelinense]MTI45430.1 UDP-N-acetylmuramoyl-L-alanine--D-glutamate ligase [Roseibium hamelinense]TWI90198.1 UDP-N-acetylmuramoylalanine--D-glutamate ligase [Roseibium hamelinense]
MIPITSFDNRHVALFGLGGSGMSTARALNAGGCRVTCWDDNAERVQQAAAGGLQTEDLKQADWSAFSALILSPGVPLTHPVPHWTVDKASDAGIEVIGDIELFCRERRHLCPDAPLIAITGTNGKSTTTALVAHLLNTLGFDTQMGGNIGVPVLDLEPPATGRCYVIECSSYQIDLAPTLDPSIGIHMNLSPDHLDRHGTLEHYASIKERLVAGSKLAIVGVDDRLSAMMADRLELAHKPVVRIAGERELPDGVYAYHGQIYEALDGTQREVASLSGINSLRGDHNGQNAAAAYSALKALNVGQADISEALKSFPGLHHRMEVIARHGRVLFINDSKATNSDAAARALSSFERIYWIAGGREKEGGIQALDEYFPRIAKAYLIGEAADDFAATLDGHVDYEISGTVEEAVKSANRDVASDGAPEIAVLLSPAGASFDQFANFELRGKAFTEAVMALNRDKTSEEVA